MVRVGEWIRVLELVASSRGGGASHVRDLAMGLDPTRFVVEVAMPEDGGNVHREDFEAVGIPFHRVDIAAGLSFRALWAIRRLARGVDILHVHGSRAALYGRLAAATLGRRRPRVVFSIHGFATPFYSLLKRTVYLWLERVLQGLTDWMICVAEAEGSLVLSFGLRAREGTCVVPYGIDVKRFAAGGVEGGCLREELGLGEGLVVLMVCRLDVPRDFDSLLEAFCEVRAEFGSAQLLIVGDGPGRGRVEARVEGLGLGDCAHVTGFRDDVPALMALADVYVLTSCGWEGYPISTLEAQAAGVPVVVTEAGGSAEAVHDGEAGIVVPMCEPGALAGAILCLLRDAGLRQRMGEGGRKRAGIEFTCARMVEQISGIYEGLVSC